VADVNCKAPVSPKENAKDRRWCCQRRAVDRQAGVRLIERLGMAELAARPVGGETAAPIQSPLRI